MLLSAPLAVSLVRASCAGYGEKDQLLLRSNRAGLVVPVHSSAPGLICGVARFGFGNAAARLVSSSSDATNQRSKWLTLLVLRTRDSSSNCNFFFQPDWRDFQEDLPFLCTGSRWLFNTLPAL